MSKIYKVGKKGEKQNDSWASSFSTCTRGGGVTRPGI